jgi:hypothetical protein
MLMSDAHKLQTHKLMQEDHSIPTTIMRRKSLRLDQQDLAIKVCLLTGCELFQILKRTWLLRLGLERIKFILAAFLFQKEI